MDLKYFIKETLRGDPAGRSREELDLFKGTTKVYHYELAGGDRGFPIWRTLSVLLLTLAGASCVAFTFVSSDLVSARVEARQAAEAEHRRCANNPWANDCQ